MKLRLNSLILGLGVVLAFLLGISAGNSVLVSPSHPFVDQNGNGIDDFEEQTGDYADPTVRVKIYGIDFPISDLGGCGDYYACRSFCEDPLNAESCTSYFKSRGLYQDDPVTSGDEGFLTRAKGELGCDSLAACQNFCEVPANYDRCDNFARTHDLGGGYTHDTQAGGVLEKAKTVLGCDSYSSCRSFCDDPANVQKCSSFAQTTGLRGGEHQVGPGGCTSAQTCSTFCSDPNNFEICSGFQAVSGARFAGPGGCNSPESCRDFCEQNPSNCGYVAGTQTGGPPPGYYNPQEMCNRTPNCAWQGNTCQCGFYGETRESAQRGGEYAAYCAANPDKCGPGQAAGFANQQAREEFEKFCRENPEKCRPVTTGTYTPSPGASPYPGGYYGGYPGGYVPRDPATECSRYGCTWTGSSCHCAGISGGNYSTTSCSEPTSGCGSGMTWDRGTCTCKPASGCPAGTSWNGSYCMQDSGPGGGSSTGCSPPPGGCGSGWFDNSSCSCKPASSQGCYNVSASSCGSGFYWDASACTCRSTSGTSSGGGTGGTSPGTSCGTGYYWTGSYCAPSSGSGTGTYTPPPDSGTYTQPSQDSGSYTPPSGGESGSYTPPPSEPAPQPVQGVATVRNFFQLILDFFGETFGR